MLEVRNPFVARRTAERYHLGRPYHHERTLRRLLETVPTTRGVAIDVAGGTRLSTRALSALGFRAVGIDPVEAMLALAAAFRRNVLRDRRGPSAPRGEPRGGTGHRQLGSALVRPAPVLRRSTASAHSRRHRHHL